MSSPLRIGTRDSELALWQANTVKNGLEALGHVAQLVPVKSLGDLVLDKPLYELGVTGIFTKTLDIALLKGEIDLAVHSMKDVPTQLPQGIVQVAVLKRADAADVLVHRGLNFLNEEGIVATGSLRRRAQWLHRYPLHEMVDLRGNVNTRLQKLEDSKWNAAIFAMAGLQRIGLLPENTTKLNWMLPAPAQGAMVVVALEKDEETIDKVAALNHTETELCTQIERAFLRTLEGGCSAPIGALAKIKDQKVYFKGGLFSLDGKRTVTVEKEVAISAAKALGELSAKEVLDTGGKEIMEDIRNANGALN
ncbi:hydroxymethylbilane synthase [Allomuricauda sp. SCSIO 65647]|uniref:hydroxymethylbilane synthase n=1 Tax=Allomuricauda sp. SCSIO 65647 TaxID=2908843 RepID=UPI001F030D4C|nr:hydroxymethylbilane synthase [Muricauda sp. SCSIO 65647]UJH68939.1 hydroxymethylbilane synthase [Muricauda sp. SCSIO 65647]